MSEDQVEEEVVVAEEPVQEEERGGSSMFDTLFQSVEAEEPEPEEKPETPISLGEFLDAESEEPEETVEEEGEVVAEESQAEEAEEVQEATPKKKVKKIRKIEDPKPEEPKAEEPKEEEKEDPFIAELLPQERERYELAKFASESDERHNGLHDKYLDFFKKQKEYIDKRDTDGEPIEDYQDDDDYRNFLRVNGVNIDPAEVRRLDREKLKAEVRQETEGETRAELEKLKKAQKQAEVKPAIEQAKAQYNTSLQEVIPKEILEVAQKDGLEAAEKLNPFEYRIVDEEVRRAQAMSAALMDISAELTEYSESDAAQSELIKFIDTEQTSYIETGDTKDDNGRVFMRRERYNSIPDSERENYWTWTNDDILKLMKFRTGQHIESGIDAHRKQMEAAGYTRQNQSQPAPLQAPMEPKAPQTPAPRPSAGSSAPTVSPPEAQHPLSVLGF